MIKLYSKEITTIGYEGLVEQFKKYHIKGDLNPNREYIVIFKNPCIWVGKPLEVFTWQDVLKKTTRPPNWQEAGIYSIRSLHLVLLYKL